MSEPPASLYAAPLFTARREDVVGAGDGAPRALHTVASWMCCCEWDSVQDWRGVRGFWWYREACCVWGCWHKDSLFCPWRQVTFASGLICILSHYAGMLLLLLAGPLFPDKTHLKALGPLRCYLFLLLHVCKPPPSPPHTLFFLWFLLHRLPSPFSFRSVLYAPYPISFVFCLFCQLRLCLSVQCLLDLIYRGGRICVQ